MSTNAYEPIPSLKIASFFAILACIGYCSAFALGSIILPAFYRVASTNTSLVLQNISIFGRNVGALGALGATVLLAKAWLQRRDGLPWPVRFALGVVVATYLATVVYMSLCPSEALSLHVLLFANGLGYLMAFQVAFSGLFTIPEKRGRGLCAFLGVIALSSFTAFLGTTLGLGGSIDHKANSRLFHRVGELCYLLFPLVFLFHITLRTRQRAAQEHLPRRRLAIGLGAAVAVGTGLLVFERSFELPTQLVVYGALRLEMFLPDAAWVYWSFIGSATGISAYLLGSGPTPDKQLAGASLLLLVAGFAPHTPARLLALVLAALLTQTALLTRSPTAQLPEPSA